MKFPIDVQWQIWQKFKWTNPVIKWQGEWLENGFCYECRLCCGPQPGDKPFPMALLPEQIYPGIEETFYMYDETHASLDQRGCKALGAQGCSVSRDRRPPVCGLFPIVLTAGRLYLYTVCPAAILLPLSLWFSIGQKAKVWLQQLPLSGCKHLDIDVPIKVLVDRYIDLHLPVWDKYGASQNS